MVRRRSRRTVDVVALGDVLGSLDNAHGELVYSKLFLRYIQTGVFEQIDAGKAKKYIRTTTYNWLYKLPYSEKCTIKNRFIGISVVSLKIVLYLCSRK